MTNTEALEILEQYQAWRRGADTEMLEPKDIGKAIDVAIDALKRTQWQPIETASKDGTRMLLVIDHGEYGDKVWTGLWANDWMISYGKAQYAPTHWMPLPPAPLPKS